jgi:DNA-binding MarR family transcriptional regulator
VISENGVSSIVLALHRTTHHTLYALRGVLAGENLSAAEINALANLAGRGALNVRELAAETGTRATTLTGVLDRLESRGYLTRELDAADRRSFRLPLTAAGQAVAERVQAAVAGLEGDALARLSPTQIAGFHAVVAALQEAS